jgi:hypothetical protein
MQFFINMKKADQVISTAPAINKISVAFKRNTLRVELFDYGTPMGWGYDVRTRVFLNGVTLPFGAEQIHQRKRPDWLPSAVTIGEWNRQLKLAVQTITP